MTSQEYWKNREAEQRKHNIRDEAEYQKHIREIYQNMIDEIEKEINGFYGKYAKKEGITIAEARKRAAKADIEALGRKAAKYVKEKNFSQQANEEMRLYNMTMKVNRLELLKAQIGLEMVAGFDELQKYYEEILTERTISEFERQAGILGKTIQNNAKAANAIVNASFHNATYSDRIWMYQDMLKNELSSLLQTGLIQGQNPRRLATHLRKRFGVSQSNAERLMITELARVQTEAQKQSFERNGFEEYTFLALGTACPICRALDGKHFKLKKMMSGTNAPPMHPRCKCSTSAYEDSEDYEAWLDYLSKGGTTEEWNRLKKKKEDESDGGRAIFEKISGISKQRKEFEAGLSKMKSMDVKLLLEQSLERVTIKRAKGSKTRYSSKENTVYLSKYAKSDSVAHELFHEIDDTYGLTENGAFSRSISQDFRRLQNMSKGYGKSIEEMLKERFPDSFKSGTTGFEMRMEYRGISDIIHGCSKGNIFLGWGHRKPGYWSEKLALEKEAFAQYGRMIYNQDEDVLDMFNALFPETSKEMDDRIRRVMK